MAETVNLDRKSGALSSKVGLEPAEVLVLNGCRSAGRVLVLNRGPWAGEPQPGASGTGSRRRHPWSVGRKGLAKGLPETRREPALCSRLSCSLP